MSARGVFALAPLDRIMLGIRRLVQWSALLWVVIFWRLGYLGLLDPDEAHYAELTREMTQRGSWFVPLLDGSPFIDKPFFFHWTQAASVAMFGDSELALRLPTALAAVALVAAVWWCAKQLFHEDTAHPAAMMFITLPATFALSSVAVFDMLFSTFLFSGLACLVVAAARHRPRLEYPGHAFLALAVMVKGPVALVLAGMLAAASCAFDEPRTALRRLRLGTGTLFVVVATLPWFAWMSVTFGERFVHDYLLAGNLWYLTGPAEFSTRVSDPFFYGRTFLGAFFPWSLVAMAGAVDDFRSRDSQETPVATLGLWLWIACVIGLFSAARFKLDTYLFPAAPACAILASVAWQRASVDATRTWTRTTVWLIAVILIGGGSGAAVGLLKIDLGLGRLVVLLPAVFLVGGACLFRALRATRPLLPASPRIVVATLAVAFAVVVELGFPLLESSRPTRILGRWIARHTSAATEVGTYDLDDWHASIRYYSERTVRRLANPTEIRQFLENAPTATVLMLQSEYENLRRDNADLNEVAASRAIVGRTGKVFRRQQWGNLVVVTLAGNAARLTHDAEKRE